MANSDSNMPNDCQPYYRFQCEPIRSTQPLATPEASLAGRIQGILAANNVSTPIEKIRSFADEIEHCQRGHAARLHAMERATVESRDILAYIAEAQRTGDSNEALWRAFLAVHFGQNKSAGLFLCGFGAEPFLTWKRVSDEHFDIGGWLREYKDQLKDLRYGNHRKFESKKPDHIESVVSSFIEWAFSHGGSPEAAFTIPGSLSPTRRFAALYQALDIARFGRTACFDLLCLLGEMNILQIEPDSCYIDGSTGPLRGAVKLCGAFKESELSHIADSLAHGLDMPPTVIEDALCMWQKQPGD